MEIRSKGTKEEEVPHSNPDDHHVDQRSSKKDVTVKTTSAQLGMVIITSQPHKDQQAGAWFFSFVLVV
jgi:hypothetical protein